MSVLVDSSVWIEFFRGGGEELDYLIEEDLAVVNDLILAELLPALVVRRQRRLMGLLKDVVRRPLRIDWDEVVQLQVTCLRNGINGVGIADLIIAQHAMQNGLELLSRDGHFAQLSREVPLVLY